MFPCGYLVMCSRNPPPTAAIPKRSWPRGIYGLSNRARGLSTSIVPEANAGVFLIYGNVQPP